VGYTNIEFWRFALAVGITAIPLTFLERTSPRWAWTYVLVIVLGFAVVGANARGLQQASTYFSKVLGKTRVSSKRDTV
jgi:hypothetical protein